MRYTTTEIDKENMKRALSISEIAERELANFAASVTQENTALETYQKFKEAEMPVAKAPEVLYEYEFENAGTVDVNVISNKQETAAAEHATTKQFSLSLRGKLLVGVVSSILLLLSILLIYNAVTINSLNDAIVNKTQIAQAGEMQSSTLDSELQQILNGIDTEALGFEQALHAVTLTEGNAVTEVPVFNPATNWFDALCNFISKIFGR